MGERLYSTKELEGILNVSRQTVHNWVREGYLAVTKVGRTNVYKEQVVKDFMKTERYRESQIRRADWKGTVEN